MEPKQGTSKGLATRKYWFPTCWCVNASVMEDRMDEQLYASCCSIIPNLIFENIMDRRIQLVPGNLLLNNIFCMGVYFLVILSPLRKSSLPPELRYVCAKRLKKMFFFCWIGRNKWLALALKCLIFDLQKTLVLSYYKFFFGSKLSYIEFEKSFLVFHLFYRNDALYRTHYWMRMLLLTLWCGRTGACQVNNFTYKSKWQHF